MVHILATTTRHARTANGRMALYLGIICSITDNHHLRMNVVWRSCLTLLCSVTLSNPSKNCFHLLNLSISSVKTSSHFLTLFTTFHNTLFVSLKCSPSLHNHVLTVSLLATRHSVCYRPHNLTWFINVLVLALQPHPAKSKLFRTAELFCCNNISKTLKEQHTLRFSMWIKLEVFQY